MLEGEEDKMVTAGSIVAVVPTIISLAVLSQALKLADPRPRKKVRIKVGKRVSLGGKGFFSLPAKKRRRMLVTLAKKIGEKRVIGKLRAIQVFNKNRNPGLSEKARLDARFVASSFVGRKRVRTGIGLSRRKR